MEKVTVTVCLIFVAVLLSCKDTPYTELVPKEELYSVNAYVGASTCIECHNQEYDNWTGSHHDLAMQIANDSSVVGDFNNATAEIDGVSYLFFKKEEEFFVKIKEIDDSETEYKITYAFGFTPLQQYLVDFDKGKKQVLRVSWDAINKKWYHQYKGDSIEPNDWLHWTGGAQNWNTMCAECHSTNLQKNYDADADTFHTTYSEINVACESCHGPAKSHISWAKKNPLDKNTHISKGFNQDEQLNQCAGCHARRSKLTANSEPGKNFENQFILQTLSTEYYHGDGQIDEEDYVYGSFRQSKMFAEGVKCSDCHDPHSLELKFDGNKLCTQCHVPKVYDTETHHFHAENTEASLCINCHMTGKNYMGNDFRRDHSFRIPRPDQSLAYGTPNACIGCHEDKNDQWATNRIKKWYGNTRQEHFSDALLISSKTEISLSERQRLDEFINSLDFPNIARATVIENLNFTNEAQFNTLLKALNDSSALVRYNALLKFRALSPEIRKSIALKHMNDSIKMVRIGAAQLVLGIDESNFSAIDQTGLNQSLEEYEAMLFANADFSLGRLQIGDYYLQKNDINNAIKHYKMALQKDSLLIPVYSNLATAYSIVKEYSNAHQILDEWLLLEPKLGRPHFLKALLNFETGDDVFAVSELQLAISLDPSDTKSMYNLATYYYQENKNLPLAERYATKALRIEPNNQNYKYLLALIYENLGQLEKSQGLMKELQPNQ